jgi:hypothetical protein
LYPLKLLGSKFYVNTKFSSQIIWSSKPKSIGNASAFYRNGMEAEPVYFLEKATTGSVI